MTASATSFIPETVAGFTTSLIIKTSIACRLEVAQFSRLPTSPSLDFFSKSQPYHLTVVTWCIAAATAVPLCGYSRSVQADRSMSKSSASCLTALNIESPQPLHASTSDVQGKPFDRADSQ